MLPHIIAVSTTIIAGWHYNENRRLRKRIMSLQTDVADLEKDAADTKDYLQQLQQAKSDADALVETLKQNQADPDLIERIEKVHSQFRALLPNPPPPIDNGGTGDTTTNPDQATAPGDPTQTAAS